MIVEILGEKSHASPRVDWDTEALPDIYGGMQKAVLEHVDLVGSILFRNLTNYPSIEKIELCYKVADHFRDVSVTLAVLVKGSSELIPEQEAKSLVESVVGFPVSSAIQQIKINPFWLRFTFGHDLNIVPGEHIFDFRVDIDRNYLEQWTGFLCMKILKRKNTYIQHKKGEA